MADEFLAPVDPAGAEAAEDQTPSEPAEETVDEAAPLEEQSPEGAALPLDPSPAETAADEAPAAEEAITDQIPDPIDTNLFAVLTEAEPAGPVRQVSEVRTEEIQSLKNPGKTYVFTTYSDGNVEVRILSADGEES